MRLMINFMLFLFLCSFLGCKSSKVVSTEDKEMLDALVNKKSFQIISQWAQPQASNAMMSISNAGLLPPGSNIGMIDLIGNSNYLKFKGDTIEAYLPYFGERQMGARLGSNKTGIEFNDVPKNYEVKEGKKNGYAIRFEISDKNSNTETYNVLVNVYTNLRAVININSSQRFSIQYRGNASELSQKD